MREPCLCGCGEIPKGKESRFCPGHYSRTSELKTMSGVLHATDRAPANIGIVPETRRLVEAEAPRRGISLGEVMRECVEAQLGSDR